MKDHTNESNHNGRGRPSKYEQLQIEKRLRPLFMKGMSSYSASITTGCNINTVKKYYDKFFQETRDSEGPEFDQACKDRTISACLAIDAQLMKMEQMQKELEQKSQIGVTQDIQQYKVRISLCNLISDLNIKRLSIANSPTADEMLAALSKVEGQK